jgi:hypothetical protein
LIQSAALALGMGSAAAAEYTLFLYETPADMALRTEKSQAGQAYWAAYGSYAKALQDSGVIRGGAPLQASESASVVTVTDGKAATTSGAYASTDLMLGGYFKIDVADDAAALAWAAKAPAALRGGKVEVRAGFPAPQM